MPNDYFQFKQFLVKQDKCAMKVCTDACLFGAWVADAIVNCKLKIENVLDIGTGTGLLSLMLAQKLPNAMIDAVEIDEAAAKQAKENFAASPWKGRLHVYHDSIQNFAATADKKYDVIICNPPFYENDLKSDDARRNVALHSSGLKLEELVNIADKLLKEEGSFFVLLPFSRMDYFEELSEEKFFVKGKISVRQTEERGYFRILIWITKQDVVPSNEEFLIMDSEKNYTDVFIGFLKDYHLKL